MKFPIFTCIAIMFTAFYIIMYVMFSYGFHNPDTGAFTLLDEQRDVMLGTGEWNTWAQDLLEFLHNVWGTGFVLLVIVTVICAFVDVLRSPKESL